MSQVLAIQETNGTVKFITFRTEEDNIESTPQNYATLVSGGIGLNAFDILGGNFAYTNVLGSNDIIDKGLFIKQEKEILGN